MKCELLMQNGVCVSCTISGVIISTITSQFSFSLTLPHFLSFLQQNLTPMKSRVKKTPSPKDSPLKTARDTERRNRLKEAKLKQAQIMASNVDDDVVTIFAPNK